MEDASPELNLPPVIKTSNNPEIQAKVDEHLTQMEDDNLHKDPNKTSLELISANKLARDLTAADLKKERALLQQLKAEEKQQEAESISETDPLTGVLNRRGFEKRIKQIKSEEDATHIFIDMDDLKKLNETLGHQGADEVIQDVTHNLQEIFGNNAIIARTGGDEFQIIVFGDTTHVFNEFVSRKMPSVSAGATKFTADNPLHSEQLADSGTYTSKLLKGDNRNHLVIVQDEENSVEYKAAEENLTSFPQQDTKSV